MSSAAWALVLHAFGLMALSYEDPQRVANFRKPIVFPKGWVAV